MEAAKSTETLDDGISLGASISIYTVTCASIYTPSCARGQIFSHNLSLEWENVNEAKGPARLGQ